MLVSFVSFSGACSSLVFSTNDDAHARHAEFGLNFGVNFTAIFLYTSKKHLVVRQIRSCLVSGLWPLRGRERAPYPGTLFPLASYKLTLLIQENRCSCWNHPSPSPSPGYFVCFATERGLLPFFHLIACLTNEERNATQIFEDHYTSWPSRTRHSIRRSSSMSPRPTPGSSPFHQRGTFPNVCARVAPRPRRPCWAPES